MEDTGDCLVDMSSHSPQSDNEIEIEPRDEDPIVQAEENVANVEEDMAAKNVARPAEVKENFQGPHRWRERLRPVRRKSNERRLTGISKKEAAAAENQHGTTTAVDRSDSFDRYWKDGRKLSKEEKIDDSKIRERLKSMPAWNRGSTEGRRKGPMVVRHSVAAPGANSQIPVSNIPVPHFNRRRHHFSPQVESAFTRNVVNSRPTSPGPGLPRKRLSPHNSFQFRQPGLAAGAFSGKRTPSPNSALYDPSLNTEVNNKRIAKVLRARLYLLQQTGPNSFMIGGDSPDHKFRVIIGQQTCSCGKGPHCVHLLFVMLRVFQVPENDPCLWAKTLKNYEVESMFRVYHDKRSSRLAVRNEHRKSKQPSPERSDSPTEEDACTPTGEEDDGDTGSGKDEEDTCPICLLEMVEGESLLKCESACQNRLHLHCITIWFEECRRQHEPLICPLCRAQWKTSIESKIPEVGENGVPPIAPPNTRASSPTPEPRDNEGRLPHAEPIPQEYRSTASPWIEVLGEDLVCCLFSRNWNIRETALRHLSGEVVATLLRGMGEGRSGVMVSPVRQAATHHMLECCCSVLAFMCADPVYKVFVACLRTLRTMMSYTPCRDTQQRKRLQTLLKPILDTILVKCTDGNRRTSQLSISTMLELAKGQNGELAVGREIVNPGSEGLGGLGYVVQCVTEVYHPDSVQWQWILGRMLILERLLEDFAECFSFRDEGLEEEGGGVLDDLDGSFESAPGKPASYHYIIAICQFAIKTVGYTHVTVAKLARRVFLMSTHYAAQDESATAELESMLANTEARLAPALRRKFKKIVKDVRFSQNAADGDAPDEEATSEITSGLNRNNSNASSLLLLSPSISPVSTPMSTPRCNSPEPASIHQDDLHSEVGASFSGTATCALVAPPNTPRHERRNRPDPEGSSDILDSLDMSDHSEARETDDLHQVMLSRSNSMLDDSPSIPEEPAISVTEPQLEATVLCDPVEASLTLELTEKVEALEANEKREDDIDLPQAPSLSLVSEPMENENCSTCAEAEIDSYASQLEQQVTRTPAVSCRMSLRSSLNSVEVVSGCDVEAAHDADEHSSQHKPVPSCSCHQQENCPDKSTTRLKRSLSNQETRKLGEAQDDESQARKARSRYSRSVMLTEDLDFRFSPPHSVSFKTEVATPSPKHSPSTSANQASNTESEYRCKEEVELEEALALAKAMDVSSKQDPTPIVPGLTPTDREEVITIRIQPEEKSGDEDDSTDLCPSTSQPKLYLENIHWVKGMLLGTGAFSTCYQSRDVKTGVIMAVKQISFCRNSPSEQEKVIEAITEEIHMMTRLNHPNVARILGATRQGCHFNMFVEWMAGGSVAFLLDQYGAFSEPVIISYTQQVLRGLAYLHDNHILHRDLKGANLLTDSAGQRLRIGDFGAAARLASQATGAGEFQGQLLGTIAFMAPEVLRGENYGRSCDVWSVGCVMIEMATRKPPWNGKDVTNHLKLIFKIATCDQPPPIPPNISPPIRDVMLRCLELKSDDRPTSKDLLLHPLFTQYHVPR